MYLLDLSAGVIKIYSERRRLRQESGTNAPQVRRVERENIIIGAIIRHYSMFAWRPSEFSGAINASISDRAACILDSVSAQLIFRALSVEATKKTLECVKRRNRRNV